VPIRIAAAYHQTIFCPWAHGEGSVLAEIDTGQLGHLFRVVPPQPNFPPQLVPGTVRRLIRRCRLRVLSIERRLARGRDDGLPSHRVSPRSTPVEVFQRRRPRAPPS